MLYRIGQIELGTVNLGCRQGFVQHPAGRTDEGGSGQILPVAGLLTDQ